ncbi:bifunctional Elongation factor Ts [Babesia duncani]|uniref:Bifunctional Elongation factor Ts n=1 Tax=Babesia duncani TaxID=323732 RepID=A0AAD9PKM1_9APIC|nr:bifunctional Elongation factor Ts [Babesia duncani]
MFFSRLLNFASGKIATGGANFKLQMVKRLRDATRVGVTACKNALESSNWDLDLAMKSLLGSTRVVTTRQQKFGKIACTETPYGGLLIVHVTCSDDFVVRNESFLYECKNMCQKIANMTNFWNKDKVQLYNPILGNTACNNCMNKTIHDFLAKSSVEFGSTIALPEVLHSPPGDVMGLFVHAKCEMEGVTLGNRLGLARLKIQGQIAMHGESLKQLANVLAMQLVGNVLDPQDAYLDFLSQELLNPMGVPKSILSRASTMGSANDANDPSGACVSVADVLDGASRIIGERVQLLEGIAACAAKPTLLMNAESSANA